MSLFDTSSPAEPIEALGLSECFVYLVDNSQGNYICSEGKRTSDQAEYDS
jgi:hypothetical protein